MHPQAHQRSAILLAIFQQHNDRVVSANMHPREGTGAKNEITPRIAVILVVFVNECYGGNRTNNKKFLISALL